MVCPSALTGLLLALAPPDVELGDARVVDSAEHDGWAVVATSDGRVMWSWGEGWDQLEVCTAAPVPSPPETRERLGRALALPGSRNFDLVPYSTRLRELWSFEDGATDLDLFPERVDGPELDIPWEPPGYEDAGSGGLELSEPRAGWRPRARSLRETVAAADPGCAVDRVGGAGGGPAYGVDGECRTVRGAFVDCDALEAADFGPAPRASAPVTPGVEAAIQAAEARFGVARQLRMEAGPRARRSAWVPALVVGAGYAAFDAEASLDAGFLSGGGRDVVLPGVPVGSSGTSSDADDRIYSKAHSASIGWAALLLVWPLAAPEPRPVDAEGGEALAAEVRWLMVERSRPLAPGGHAALHRLEVVATLHALTGLFLDELRALEAASWEVRR